MRNHIEGTSINGLFSQLQRQFRAQILMYYFVHCGSRLRLPASLYLLHLCSRARGTSLYLQKQSHL